MRTTSSGSVMIRLPFRLNITTMVKSSAVSVSGEISGTKRELYFSFPTSFTPISLVNAPAMQGMPR